MSMSSFQLTNNEKRNRKIWLAVALLPCLMNLPVACFYCIQAAIAGNGYLAMLITVYMGMILLPGWLVWHCTYKKHGTRLLTCTLVMNFFCAIWCMVVLLTHSPSSVLLKAAFAEAPLWMILIGSSLHIYWLALSFQLRKTNKKLYMQKHCTDAYLVALEEMKASESEKDLKDRFLFLKQQWPHLKRYSSKEYKAKKRQANSACASAPSA